MTALEDRIDRAERLIVTLLHARQMLQRLNVNDIRAHDDAAFARALIADLLNQGWTPPEGHTR